MFGGKLINVSDVLIVLDEDLSNTFLLYSK